MLGSDSGDERKLRFVNVASQEKASAIARNPKFVVQVGCDRTMRMHSSMHNRSPATTEMSLMAFNCVSEATPSAFSVLTYGFKSYVPSGKYIVTTASLVASSA